MIDDKTLDEIRSKINPQYQHTVGTESYERKLLVDEVEWLNKEVEKARLDAECYRIQSVDRGESYKKVKADVEALSKAITTTRQDVADEFELALATAQQEVERLEKEKDNHVDAFMASTERTAAKIVKLEAQLSRYEKWIDNDKEVFKVLGIDSEDGPTLADAKQIAEQLSRYEKTDIENWRTVYMGADLAEMVFKHPESGYDCFDMVKFDELKRYANAVEVEGEVEYTYEDSYGQWMSVQFQLDDESLVGQRVHVLVMKEGE